MSNAFDRGWFVGFTEAEGCFAINHRDTHPLFDLAQNDKEILEEIKHCFGFGSVTEVRKNGKAWRFGSYAKSDLETFVDLFNGNLKLSWKQTQFKRWITLFNKNYSFVKGDSTISNSPFDLGWLVGFTEGDGSFTHGSDGFPSFNLTQNDENILLAVKQFFGFGYVVKHSRRLDRRAWRYIIIHNWDALEIIKQFFKGKLKSLSKERQFSFWCGLFDDNHPLRVKGREHERLRSIEYRKNNREKHIAAVRRWQRNNPEKKREYNRRWYHKHRERELEKKRLKRKSV